MNLTKTKKTHNKQKLSKLSNVKVDLKGISKVLNLQVK